VAELRNQSALEQFPLALATAWWLEASKLHFPIPISAGYASVYREPRPTVQPAPLHAPATAVHRRKVFPAERPRYTRRAFRRSACNVLSRRWFAAPWSSTRVSNCEPLPLVRRAPLVSNVAS